MDERRRQRAQERICFNSEVMINDSFACRSLDISEGGIYVLTDHAMAVGSVVKVTLDTGKEKVDIKARVKHAAEGLGIGLMFIDLNDALKKKIKEFVQETKNKDLPSR